MRTLLSLFTLAVTLSACGKDGRPLPDGDGDTDTSVDGDTTDIDTDDDTLDISGPFGFVGSPCTGDSDCEYDGAVCLTEADGFPGGMCSLECDRLCPDEPGFPTTFCVDGGDLVESRFATGSCSSRCDFGTYDDDGCRDGYGCVVASRYAEQSTETFACLPNAASDLSGTILDLADRGVSFEPVLRGVDHPAGMPDVDCIINNPVRVHSPMLGVTLKNGNGDTPSILIGAAAAHALADVMDDVRPLGVEAVIHYGTYNCRVIGGTRSLSQHGLANAIDIAGFEFTNGDRYTLYNDWVHMNSIDTPPPSSNAGATFLYNAAHRWHDNGFWNIILTPQYNAAHDNHFHVDLTPGASTLRTLLGADPVAPYLGPGTYVD